MKLKKYVVAPRVFAYLCSRCTLKAIDIDRKKTPLRDQFGGHDTADGSICLHHDAYVRIAQAHEKGGTK